MMQARLGAQMGGAVIQPMASPGVEAIIGLAADSEFGPVVMVGLSGVLTDLLQDRAFCRPAARAWCRRRHGRLAPGRAAA